MIRHWELKKELIFDDLSPSMRLNNEMKLADMVYELSGNFVEKVDCDFLLNT